MKKKIFKQHYSGLWVAEDGEVLVPQSGGNPEHYTYGTKTPDGHMVVGYQGKRYYVHILVAECFLNGNKPIDTKLYAVHHINVNPSDNRVGNLRILTHPAHMKLHTTGEKNYFYGKHYTGEDNPFYGKHHSDETRKKLSEALKGEKHPMYGKFGADNPSSKAIIGTNKMTGEVREFAGIREAERVLGIHHVGISACCKGKQKSAGGWKWAYLT